MKSVRKRQAIFVGSTILWLMVLRCCLSEKKQPPVGLVGEWACEELASDGETATEFYFLRIEENGEFSLYDRDAGNPGISGTMNCEDPEAEKGVVEITCDTDDFDPPICWDIDVSDELDYEIDCASGEIRLGYQGIYLIFYLEK
ncbi:MAG: hypothetical protein ACI4ES_15120 [Roseburia sp.]